MYENMEVEYLANIEQLITWKVCAQRICFDEDIYEVYLL